MDSIFHKSAPKLFAPNIISMLQKQGITFQGVRRRKQMDRALQLSLLLSGLYVSVNAAGAIIRLIIPYSRKVAVPISLIMFLFAILKLSRGARLLNPKQAPADIITFAEEHKVGRKRAK